MRHRYGLPPKTCSRRLALPPEHRARPRTPP